MYYISIFPESVYVMWSDHHMSICFSSQSIPALYSIIISLLMLFPQPSNSQLSVCQFAGPHNYFIQLIVCIIWKGNKSNFLSPTPAVIYRLQSGSALSAFGLSWDMNISKGAWFSLYEIYLLYFIYKIYIFTHTHTHLMKNILKHNTNMFLLHLLKYVVKNV